MVNSWLLLFLLIVVLLLELFSIVFLVLQVSQVSSFPGSAIDANLTEQRHLRFPPKLDCNKLKQGNKITVQKIVRKRCTSLAVDKGTDYYRFIMDEKAQVSVDDWNSFSAGLQSIADVHFIFNGSSLAAINFPSLKTIKQSHFKIERNEQLTSINVTMNSLVDNLNADITISNNPKLETVTLAGYGISGSVWITENRQLKTIDMDTVSLLHANEFYIENNEMLKQIKMGSLTIFNGNDFKLRGNKALEKFELPKMDSFSAANFTSIAKNDKLSIITFNSIKMGSTTEIVQNKKLTAIHTKAHYPGVSKNFILRGNPNLPQKILDYYRNNTYIERERNDIQVFGECIFDEVIKNFADLDDCIIINSAVKFTSSTAGDITNNQLKEINGDVNLAGLCREPVNFLENVKINGIIKSDVCKFQLTNHQVDSSKCTAKTCVSIMPVSPIATTSKTTAKSKSTPSRPVVKPTKATPSGSLNSTEVPPAFGKNTDKTGGSSKVGIICGAVAGAVILILLILILMCCCVPVPAGGGRNGKVKMYKRVLPWWNKVGTDASSSKGSLTSASSHKTSARKSDVQKGEGEPLLRQKTKEKVSRVPIRQPAPSQAEREMERLLPEPEMRTARGFPSFASLMATYSARAPTVSREPSVSGRAPTDPILDSISARPPSEREEERATLTARLTPGTLPTVPQGPERFIVTKDGEVLRQPRINYQHELLARMEDFFGNEENYEDLLEEVKSRNDGNNSKKDGNNKTFPAPDCLIVSHSMEYCVSYDFDGPLIQHVYFNLLTLLAVISPIIFLYTIYCIIYQSSKMAKSYCWYLVAHQISAATACTYLHTLSRPVAFVPKTILGVTGILKEQSGSFSTRHITKLPQAQVSPPVQMASVFHYFFLLVQIQAVLCGLIDRISRTPQQSAKNLLSSRNCYFSPTQCFLPRVFDKYVPAQNTSSVIGRRPRRIRPHHHRALAYMTTNIRNKLILQTQAQKKM